MTCSARCRSTPCRAARRSAAANQDPTRAPSATPGASALSQDLLRPYQGYGAIRMWEYSGYSNYHSLQTGVTRRFDDGLMFSVFYVWSKTLGINNNDGAAGGLPNSTDDEVRRLDYSLIDTDRPHNFVTSFIYQMPFFKDNDSVLSWIAGNWQVSGNYRWTSGRPQAVNFNIPGIGAANLTGSADGNPNARIVLTCDPGTGWSDDQYAQFNTSCFAPPQPGSDGAESARFFLRQPPINNVDLSLSKAFGGPKSLRFEFRIDVFNLLNHTQFTGFNGTANFASLTDHRITNLPYDAAGNLVRRDGFGSVSNVAAPRSLQLVTRVTF